MSDQKIKAIVGKTIEQVTVRDEEASDSCQYAIIVMKFTDGSSYEMKLTPWLAVDGIFFKNDNDDDTAKETQLVRP
jgi:hypothetical protein